MGKWSVSETGLNYLMEYTNGFKRSIRKNQVIKSNTYLGEEYSSSQSPNLLLATVIASVRSYSAGISTITFTNNGGDDWDVDFKIATDTTPQLPSGCSIDNYDTNISFYVGGGGTPIDSTTGNITDYTKNISGNGAGVYFVEQIYNVYLGASQVSFFAIQSLYKVNGSGTLLAYFKGKGITVNSVLGLNINVTANVEQSESYAIEWYSYDISMTPTLIGMGLTASLTLPTDCAYLIAQPILDSVFTTDFPSQTTTISTVTIN